MIDWITDGTTPEVDDEYGVSELCLVSVREVLPDQGPVFYVKQAEYNVDEIDGEWWTNEYSEPIDGVYAWAGWPEPATPAPEMMEPIEWPKARSVPLCEVVPDPVSPF